MATVKPAERITKREILSLIDRYGGKNNAMRESSLNNTPRTQTLIREMYEDGLLKREGPHHSYTLTEEGREFLVDSED